VRFYGDGAQWPRIYEANTAVIGADPNVLTGGLRLQILAQ
jgi:nucleoid-associated protein YgaU